MDLEDVPWTIFMAVMIVAPVCFMAFSMGLFDGFLDNGDDAPDYSFELTTTSTTIGVNQEKTLISEMALTYIFEDMKWSSSDDSILSVRTTEDGGNKVAIIKGLKEGDAVITVTSGDCSRECRVHVSETAPDNEIRAYNPYSKTNRYAVLSGPGFESGVLTLSFNNEGYNAITLCGYTTDMLEMCDENNGEACHDFKSAYMTFRDTSTDTIVSSKTYDPETDNSVVLPTGEYIYEPNVTFDVDFLITLRNDVQYHVTGSVVYKENDGSKDSTNIVKRSFAWRYDDKVFSFNLEFPYGMYSRYHTQNISYGNLNNYNHFRNYSENTGTNVFTHSNEVTKEIVAKLAMLYRNTYGHDKGLNTIEYANFILGFVQIGWYYSLDDEQYVDGESTDSVDYWGYPMETIYSGCGDCEDTSILAATLFYDAGFKSGVFLIPYHAMAAVHVENYTTPDPIPEGYEYMAYKSNGVVYYGCESTCWYSKPVGMGASELINDSNGIRYKDVEIYTV